MSPSPPIELTNVGLPSHGPDSRVSSRPRIDSGVVLDNDVYIGGNYLTPTQVVRRSEETVTSARSGPSIYSVSQEADTESGPNHRRMWGNHVPQSTNLGYELPNAVLSVRDGWQWTCQSGAVVSGLLAAVAAQLLTFFKADSSYADHIPNYGGAKGFLLGSCYFALFLNISATISSFILIDNLGEIGYRASGKAKVLKKKFEQTSTYSAGQDKLLMEFGASLEWKWMLFHWLATFYLGILALIVSILTYVFMQEALATKIVMGVIIFLTLFPVSYFIFRPLVNFKHLYN